MMMYSIIKNTWETNDTSTDLIVYSSIAQSVVRWTSNWKGAGSSPIIEKVASECSILGYKLMVYNLAAVTDWGDTNSRSLGLVSVGEHDH